MILQNRRTQNKLDPNPPRWPAGKTLAATVVVAQSRADSFEGPN
jgi:hypothetical protein